jgi:hypothetical protein
MKRGIIYRGPSLIDGKPIVAVATFTDRNRKTGAVVQTYILCQDVAPVLANKTGADVSICGACPLRGTATDDPGRKLAAGRACYVRIDQGPTIVWKGLQRDAYPDAQGDGDLVTLGRGRVVRLGTYGDPAAVPLHVWAALTREAASWTGYTHSGGLQPDLEAFCMVSVESLEAARAQWAAGRRTFRVMADASELDPAREVLCPASAEAGYRTTCERCRLCAGTATPSPRSVAIVAHGTGKRNLAA